MRLHNVLTSLSEVPLVIMLLNGAPWFVLLIVVAYVLRPIVIRLIECRSQETIERIRHTPATGVRTTVAPTGRKQTRKKRKRIDTRR
jgi:hypothetical protein